jgi:SAM-dependent methyltransferase
VLEFLQPLVQEPTGIDISRPMLNMARTRVPGARLILEDGSKEGVLPRDHFDLVTAFRFFLNADDDLRRGVLRAIAQTLRSDGLLIANIHGNLWSARLPSFLFRRYLLRQEMNALTLHRMRRLLREQGFSIVAVFGVGFPTRKMYRLLGRRACGAIERVLSSVPPFRYVAVNLILVCVKRPSFQGAEGPV